MRNIIYLTTISTVLLLSACTKDFLDKNNPNSVSVDESFQSESDIALAVNGMYQGLRSSNCIGEGAQLWTDDRSDDINSTDNQSNNGEPFQFTAFSLVPSNTYLMSHWSGLYVPISRANLILSQMENINFTSDSLKSQYTAECKFIRALLYFHLVREFGGVPLVTSRLTSTQQLADITYRASAEDIYAQIVQDLTDVVNSNLPVKQPASGLGRASLQAAN